MGCQNWPKETLMAVLTKSYYYQAIHCTEKIRVVLCESYKIQYARDIDNNFKTYLCKT